MYPDDRARYKPDCRKKRRSSRKVWDHGKNEMRQPCCRGTQAEVKRKMREELK